MAAKALPSQEVLRQLLDYNPETGALTWKVRDLHWFSDGSQTRQHNAAIWNGKNAGRAALVTALPTGHLYGGIGGTKYLAHRVIWKMVYGVDPIGIDHIDGNPANNRIKNLRQASQLVNGKNAKTSKRNTSGVMGVEWRSDRNKWVARITVDYRSRHLGCFDTFDAALAARKQAERELGFHENHGRSQ
jgi:hypothetical protein